MLMRTDPFRDLHRLTEAVLGSRSHPAVMPMDAWREDDRFVSRQLVLGDNVDLDRIEASYSDGVLRLVVPVAEKAGPRKIEISGRTDAEELNA